MNDYDVESAAAAPGPPENRIDAEVAAAVRSAREARKARRREEADRQRAAAELRRSQDRTIHIDTISVSGYSERRSQFAATKMVRTQIHNGSRMIVSQIARDGTLRTEVFALVGSEWQSQGAIALDAEA